MLLTSLIHELNAFSSWNWSSTGSWTLELILLSHGNRALWEEQVYSLPIHLIVFLFGQFLN